MAKHKRLLVVAVAIVFLVLIYFTKNGLPWPGKAVYEREGGLDYTSALVEDLIKKDTDGDGVLDWEENLFGLDPTKSETTAGTPDITVVNKLRGEAGISGAIDSENGALPTENLTKTDQFAQELFSTVTALEQSGALDQQTAEKIVASLTENLENSLQNKTYATTDIKIATDSSVVAVQKYNNALNSIFGEYTLDYSVAEVFEKFVGGGSSVDTAALSELDPIINQFKSKAVLLSQTPVPKTLASAHLNFINALQKMAENLEQVQMYEQDSIVTLGAIMQYPDNSTALENTALELMGAVQKELNR